MPDTLPSSGDRTVVIHRFGPLTWISLAFNALILLLILFGMAAHHHRQQMADRGASGDRCPWQRGEAQGPGDFHRRDFGHMHPSWQHDRFGEEREHDHRDWNDSGHSGWSESRPNDFHGPDRPPTPVPSTEAMTDRFMLLMTDKLALTDPESAKIRPIVQDQIAQFQKDMEAQKAAHQKMIDDAKTRIRPLLTPDQQKQFDQLTAGLGSHSTLPPDKPASK